MCCFIFFFFLQHLFFKSNLKDASYFWFFFDRGVPQLMSIPGNELCVDCRTPDPKWASINIGVTLCIGEQCTNCLICACPYIFLNIFSLNSASLSWSGVNLHFPLHNCIRLIRCLVAVNVIPIGEKQILELALHDWFLYYSKKNKT